MELEESSLLGTNKFTINTTGAAMSILSGAMYKNAPLAVLRELVCNAVDSTVDAGSTDPVEVVANYRGLYVSDKGLGLPAELVPQLFTSYFKSSKDETNPDGTGFYGLGCKSPFSVTDNFYVTAGFTGVTNKFHMHKNDKGEFLCTHQSKEITHTLNGVEVYVPGMEATQSIISRALFPFKKGVINFNGTPFYPSITDAEASAVFSCEGGFIGKLPKVLEQGPWVVYKNVMYPIGRLVSFPMFIAGNSLVLKVPSTVRLDIPPSREELAETPNNRGVIGRILAEFSDKFKEKLEAFIDSGDDASAPVKYKLQEEFASTYKDIVNFYYLSETIPKYKEFSQPIYLAVNSYALLTAGWRKNKFHMEPLTTWRFNQYNKVVILYNVHVKNMQREAINKFLPSSTVVVIDTGDLSEAESWWASTLQEETPTYLNYRMEVHVSSREPKAAKDGTVRSKVFEFGTKYQAMKAVQLAPEALEDYTWLFFDKATNKIVYDNSPERCEFVKEVDTFRTLNNLSHTYIEIKNVRVTSLDNYELVSKWLFKDVLIAKLNEVKQTIEDRGLVDSTVVCNQYSGYGDFVNSFNRSNYSSRPWVVVDPHLKTALNYIGHRGNDASKYNKVQEVLGLGESVQMVVVTMSDTDAVFEKVAKKFPLLKILSNGYGRTPLEEKAIGDYLVSVGAIEHENNIPQVF